MNIIHFFLRHLLLVNMVYHEVMKHDSTSHHMFVSISEILAFTIFMALLNLPFNYKVNFYCKVSAGVVLTFMYLIRSTIARDVGACSAAAAPSRGWFYVDRVTHLLEFVILAKSLRKQHAMS